MIKIGQTIVKGRAMLWCIGGIPNSYRLHDGNTRALINPVPPRAWNGRARWQVDAIGLDKPVYARTLAQARELAESNA